MARENPGRGYQQIQGELPWLGYRVGASRCGGCTKVLARDPYRVGVGPAHPMARLKQIKLADPQGQPLRLFPRRMDPAHYDAVASAVASTGAGFNVWENPVPGLRLIRTRRSSSASC